MKPDHAAAYYNLGCALDNSGHDVEAAQRYLEAKERYPEGSEKWAAATGWAFNKLVQPECAEVAKPAFGRRGGTTRTSRRSRSGW